MMKRTITLGAIALTFFGCATLHHKNNKNPYQKRLFVEKYLNPANPLDSQIENDINALRANPNAATVHNELGQLLLRKGFPKDAEVEFERAVNSDSHLYPAWYNLGLVRASRGDYTGARFAFDRTIHYKPGHAAALFQLGLMEERRNNTEAALDYYAKAFAINHSLLDVRVNPRIVDSRLTDLALLRLYPNEHTWESMQFQPSPPGYISQPSAPEAPSPQAPAQQIVEPAAPITNPAQQTPPPQPVHPPG
jgi:tetratricopeptide (TPR) repeat protein